MELPESPRVDVAKLAAVFADTTNSYKFYWLLALLDELAETGQTRLPLRNLSLRMLAGVWYPLDYFKLSFGRQDGFKKLAAQVSARVTVDNQPSAPGLFHQLRAKLSAPELDELHRELDGLLRWVPYRFIRPFFGSELRGLPDQRVNGRIAELAGQSAQAPYYFAGDGLVLREEWAAYFQHHQAVLRGFTFWHLLRFVQKHNPNVIGLSEKLTKPGQRDLKLASRFWREYLTAHGDFLCIYSGRPVTPATMSLDHFLPWSLVAHDLLWNIIPTPKAVNSAKSNVLPSIEKYFTPYARLQYEAFQFHAAQGHNKLLEDYHLLFAQSMDALRGQPFEPFREQLERRVLPLLQTAQNLGFQYPFVFQP